MAQLEAAALSGEFKCLADGQTTAHCSGLLW